MTEKRFELAYEKGNWWAVRDGEITLWKEEVVDLLNEQEERIKDLTDENATLKAYITDLHEQYEETHGLSIENSEWYDD